MGICVHRSQMMAFVSALIRILLKKILQSLIYTNIWEKNRFIIAPGLKTSKNREQKLENVQVHVFFNEIMLKA